MFLSGDSTVTLSAKSSLILGENKAAFPREGHISLILLGLGLSVLLYSFHYPAYIVSHLIDSKQIENIHDLYDLSPICKPILVQRLGIISFSLSLYVI